MKRVWKSPKNSLIIGIDEVGRGALAGPVTAAAIILRKFDLSKLTSNVKRSNFPILKDSKDLTPKQREIWFNWIKKQSSIFENGGMFFTTASVSPKIIDKINILKAANLAATRSLLKLAKNYKLKSKNLKVFLDGGLYITLNSRSRGKGYNIRTIIKGDEKYNAIKLASIVAKVTRDRQMRKLHEKYPQYQFDRHKGYGTRKHIRALRKHGHSPVHRLTFIKKCLTL